MKILIVDHQPLFRKGLQHTLCSMSNNLEFLHATDLVRCDERYLSESALILADLALGDNAEIESIKRVRQQSQGDIVILSNCENANTVNACIEAGAAGFIPKTVEPDILIAALNLVLAGGTYLPTVCLHRERSIPIHQVALDKISKLTDRQMTTLLLASYGLPNKSIANHMTISEGTVKLHLSAAYKTLNVRNRTEAVYLLSRVGLSHDNLCLLPLTNKKSAYHLAHPYSSPIKQTSNPTGKVQNSAA